MLKAGSGVNHRVMDLPSLLLQPPGQQGFVFLQLHRHSLAGAVAREGAADLLLKAGEGSGQEFGQKCHVADVAAPIQVVGRGDFSQVSVQRSVVSPKLQFLL